ncbi:hypothetical protein SCHPADRAFT_911935 [Schizopora paradoxa]|uniref:Uncharacterized protein n=1 Tax=Schizopora paradoxa TaxID=27342 RepID=A0A0H2QYE2_9AGAM|nr:hypothetical protein SCHPADRAFT_911935 [Schizopora paradoxa]
MEGGVEAWSMEGGTGEAGCQENGGVRVPGARAIRQEEFSTEGEEVAEEATLDQSTSPKRAIPRRSVPDIATFRANNPTEPRRTGEAGEVAEDGATATTKVDASA